MRIVAVFQRLASAATDIFSPQVGVAEQARQRGVPRQTLYRQADEALAAVEGSAAEQQRQQLQQQLEHCQEQLAHAQQQLRQQQRYQVLLDPDKQAEFASCGQAEGVSLPVLVRLLRPLLGKETPSVAALGRLTQQAGERASGLLEVLDRHSHPLVHQASADELYSGRKPVLMAVEPDSLCWLTARLSQKRDGPEWAKEFHRLSALEQVNRDGGEGLQKGVRLINQDRRKEKKQPVAEQLDHFHTLREGSRTLRRIQGRVARAIKKAELAQRREQRCDRRGQRKTGGSGAACRKWQKAEQVFDSWAAQDNAWQEVKQALRLFTHEGELNTRDRAEALLTQACAKLSGADWDKTKRCLRQPETLTFLDRAQHRLAELPLAAVVARAAARLEGLQQRTEWTRGTDQQAAVMRGLAVAWSVVIAKAAEPGQKVQTTADVVQAAVRLEGLRRRPELTRGTSAQAAVMRGLALAWSVVIAKAGEDGQRTQQAVRGILRQAWRGSSAVEGLNSVLRMQQGRHRRLSQGLLDLKRLYWNCRPFRTGERKRQTPYARLGLRLPAMPWWQLLHLSPGQLQQHLSAQQVAA
jgi:hypothetical protein